MGLTVWGSMASGVRPASCTMGSGVLYRGVKWPGRGVDHRQPFGPEVKKEYSYNSTLPVWLHGMLQEEIYLYIQTWFPTQTTKCTN